MKLIAGLGNPGPQYARTRHNIGFMVAEAFAARHAISLKRRGHEAIYGVGRACGAEVAVVLPQTFMNRSGASIGSAYRSLGGEPGDLIVVHDDIDLPFGRLRLRAGGGHGGHNGIRHICQVLGHGDFIRIKVGVGRPFAGEVSDHVLRAFSAAERGCLDDVLGGAVAALDVLLESGLTQAMNLFNNRDFAGTSGGAQTS